MNENLVTIKEACSLLKISRPTFNKRRKELSLKELADHGQLLFFKNELLNKIYSKYPLTKPPNDFLITGFAELTSIMIDQTTFDLRQINLIDGYGIIDLFCSVLSMVAEGREVNLLVDDSYACKYLNKIGFFRELERRYKKQIYWDASSFGELNINEYSDTILPLTFIGYKGAERKIAEDLAGLLLKQGFSVDIAGFIAWIFGELADNSHTHGKGPCYILVERISGKGKKFLAIGVGDLGIGIHTSLKKNPKYSDLSDNHALLMAFKSRVSSWADDHKRGKGLCDVLKIALGNQSFFRVDSNQYGLFMNFADYKREVRAAKPATSISGTRYCLVLIDEGFAEVTREESDKIVDQNLEKL